MFLNGPASVGYLAGDLGEGKVSNNCNIAKRASNFLCVFACMFLSGLALMCWLAAGSATAETSGDEHPGYRLSSNPLVVPWPNLPEEEGEQVSAIENVRRSSPEAFVERTISETAYEHLSARVQLNQVRCGRGVRRRRARRRWRWSSRRRARAPQRSSYAIGCQSGDVGTSEFT